MKVALVHDYLVNKGGAERVVLSLHRMFPDAPILTSIHHPASTYDFSGAEVRTSFLQRFSSSAEDFRRLLPLFPAAFRSLSTAGFDLVIVSSSGFAHHVRRSAPSLTYMYTPPRFLWDSGYDTASVPRWARPMLGPTLRWLRRADRRAMGATGPVLTCGERTAAAIESVYGVRPTIVHPPVECDRFATTEPPGEGYLLLGRSLPHRNHELAITAFTQMGKSLTVVGDGPHRPVLERMAGPTITFVGAVGDREVEQHYARCRAVVVPGVEDFGLVPLEANAAGRPAIALGMGGAVETVRDGVTGVLFDDDDPASLIGAVERLEATTWDAAALVEHARTFDESAFHARVRTQIDEVLP